MDPSAVMDPATGQPLPPDAIVRVLRRFPAQNLPTTALGLVVWGEGD